jgi:hypothetical protein
LKPAPGISRGTQVIGGAYQIKRINQGFVADLLLSGTCYVGIAFMQRDMDEEEENIAIALEFYDLLLNWKDFESDK